MCQKWYNFAISDNLARSLRDKDSHVGVRQGRKRVLNAPTLFEEEDLGAVVSLWFAGELFAEEERRLSGPRLAADALSTCAMTGIR